MSSYVAYGSRRAVAIHRGFACTREELPTELQRVSRQEIGKLLAYEVYSSRDAAEAIARDYCLDSFFRSEQK